MANPQLEDGHLRIANDIWDALCRIRIPGEVRQVIDTVLRKTWGFRKKQDWISLSQFHEATGIHKPNISRALTQAIAMNIILKKENTLLDNEKAQPVTYSFNKDYDTWKPLSKKRTFSLKRKVVLNNEKSLLNNEKKSSQKRGTQKTTDILKDILKDTTAGKPPNSVDEFVEKYREICQSQGLKKVLIVNNSRRGKIRQRLKELAEAEVTVEEYMQKCANSPFLRGERGNWTADFDFIIGAQNIGKILDGKYDRRDSDIDWGNIGGDDEEE